jgi:hypothetical protein
MVVDEALDRRNELWNRAEHAVTITVSPRGWQAAALKGDTCTGRPTNSALKRLSRGFTSTTCMPPFCTCSVLYRHASRDFRLTDVYGDVVNELIA